MISVRSGCCQELVVFLSANGSGLSHTSLPSLQKMGHVSRRGEILHVAGPKEEQADIKCNCDFACTRLRPHIDPTNAVLTPSEVCVHYVSCARGSPGNDSMPR